MVKSGGPPPTTVTTTEPPPVTTTTPPAFQPGHYAGKTSQFENITLDVTSFVVQNLQVANTNKSCDPYFNLHGGAFSATNWPINPDGSFHISFSGQGTVTQTLAGTTTTVSSTYQNSIDGNVQGSMATGTFKADLQFTLSGTPYTCTSGVVTWTASLTP